MAESVLVYHTFYKEFRGNSAEEIVQQLYEDSKKGTGCTFPEWWSYQQRIWKDRYNHEVPAADAEQAPQKLLDVLLKVGALEQGQRPLPRRSGEDRGRS